MSSAVRSLTIALRVDANGMSAGVQEGLTRMQSFAAKANSINASMARDVGAQMEKVQALRDRGNFPAARWAQLKAADMEINRQRQASLAESLSQMERRYAGGGVLSPRVTDAHRQNRAASRAIDDAYYAATHTQREVDLRNLRRRYAQERLEHRGNAEMLTRINRAYAAEQARLQQAHGSRWGLPGGGRGVGAALRTGGAMALGQSGGALGAAAATGLMVGGPAGVAIAGVMIAGETYRTVQRHAESLAKTQMLMHERMSAEVRFIRSHAAPASTALGQTYRDRAESLWEEGRALREQGRQQMHNIGNWDALVARFQGAARGYWGASGVNHSDYARNARMLQDEGDARSAQAAEYMRRSIEQDRLHRGYRRADAEYSRERSRISGLPESSTKRMLELDAQIGAERREMDRQFKETIARMEMDTSTGGQEALAQERQTQQEQWQARYEHDAARKHDLIKAIERSERESAAATMEARIAVQQDGWKREEAILKHRQEREVREFAGSTLQRQSMTERHAAERELMAKNRRQELEDVDRQIERRRQLATGSSPHAIEAESLRQQLALRYGMEEADRRILALRTAQAAETAKSVQDTLDELNRRRQLAQGTLTEQQAHQQRLMAANRDLTPAQAERVAKAQRLTNLAEFARGVRDQLSPIDRFKAEREKTIQAMKAGELTRQQAQVHLQRTMRDLMGRQGGGQALDAVGWAMNVQAALLNQAKPQELLLAENKKTNEEIAMLRKEGIKIKL